MIHAEYKPIAYLLIAAAFVGAGGAAGYQLRGIAADADIANLNADHATALKAVSDEAAMAASNALQDQMDLAAHFAAIDKTKSEEIDREKIKNAKLLATIRNGDKRLSVAARCTASSGSLPKATGRASVDNGQTRAELDPSAAERIVRIATDGDLAIRQLTACQEIVSKITGQ